ncbi:MAG TPA: alpha/beta fold hydrolase [Gaiellaceae bacterium]|nr:alpha/beta fold hydrolase [Gaiellaceae bacterium]
MNGFDDREITLPEGGRIRYLVGGSGPPLALVHGLGGMATNWRLVAPPLAAERRIVIPDLPGHGLSEPLGAATTLDPFADAVLAVLEAEDALPAPWVGHSLGGLVALRAAARRPEAVQALVLAAAAGISSATRVGEAVVTVLGIVQPGKLVAPFAGRVARSKRGRTLAFSWGVGDPAALEPDMARAFLDGPALHADTLTAGRALVASDPRLDLDRVVCPCLCLWGSEDRWVPVADGLEYARRLRAPLRVIAGCGHLLVGERPEVVVGAIRAFLAEHGC